MVTDLYMIYNEIEICASRSAIGNLNLHIWMEVDGYTKLAQLVCNLVFLVLVASVIGKLDAINVYCKYWLAFIMTYCSFELVIIGLVAFWSEEVDECLEIEPTFYFSKFYQYTLVLLISSCFLIPIIFVLAFILMRTIKKTSHSLLNPE
jgi:hypothetical protein